MRSLLLWLGLLYAVAARATGLAPVAVDSAAFRADFNQPTAVTTDGLGRMFVLDGTRNRVLPLSAEGEPGAPFGADILKLPLDLAPAEEGLLLADTGHRRLVLFTPEGGLRKILELPAAPCASKPEPGRESKPAVTVQTPPSSGGRFVQTPPPSGGRLGGGRDSQLQQYQDPTSPQPLPAGRGSERLQPAPGEVECSDSVDRVAPEPVAVTVLDGLAYWSDRKTHRVCRTRLDSGETLDCFGGRGQQEGRFQYPYQIASDRDDYLHVLDIANARVQIFDKSGRHFSQVSRFGLSPGELYRPNGLAIDPKTDTLFVADSYFGTVSLFHKTEFVGMLHDAAGQPVRLDSPTGLSFRDGWLYVAETGASQVRRFRLEFREIPPAPKTGAKTVEISQKDCVICHLSWAYEAPAELRAPDEQGALPDASFRMCYSCHNGAIMDSRLAIHHAAQHPVVYESDQEKKRHVKMRPRKDKLPEQFPTTHDKQLLCTACHTPHTHTENNISPDTLYSGHHNAWLRIPNRGGDLCERCHESKAKGARETEAAKQGFNHPLAIKFAPPPLKDAKGYPTHAELHKGLPDPLAGGGAMLGHDREMICQTCHQVHGGHKEGELTVLGREKGELCAVCHPRQHSRDQDDAHARGVHPVNIERKSDHSNEKPVLWKGRPEIREVGCETCHAVHKGVQATTLMPEGVKTDGALCKNCHERQHSDSAGDAHRKGVHPVNIRRKSDDPAKPAVLWKGKPEIREVTCQTCHKVHAGNPKTSLLPKGVEEAEALCRNCHERQHAEDQDAARKKGVHPVNAKLDEPVEINGKKVEKVGCLSCHAVHKGKPDTAALVETDHNGELCSYCHQPKQTVVGTDHDLRITAKEKKNAHGQLPGEIGVCGSCHTLHRGKGAMPFLFAVKVTVQTPPPSGGRLGGGRDSKLQQYQDSPSPQTPPVGRGSERFPVKKIEPETAASEVEKMDETPFRRDRLCIECHQKDGLGQEKVVNHFSHPHEDLILRSDPKVLPLLGRDEKPADFGLIACVTCHEPHVWDAEKKPPADAVKIAVSGNRDNLEGTQRDSFLRKKGVDHTFCIDCHGQEGLLKYKFFHDAKRARNRKLDYLK